MKRPRPPSCSTDDENKNIKLPLKLLQASTPKEKHAIIKEFLTWSCGDFLPKRLERVTNLLEKARNDKDEEALETVKRYTPDLYVELEHAREHAFALRAMFFMCIGPRKDNSPFHDEAMGECLTTLSEGWTALDSPLQILMDATDQMKKTRKAFKEHGGGSEKKSPEPLFEYMVSLETGENLREYLMEHFQRFLLHYACLCYRLRTDARLILEACDRTKRSNGFIV